ncbi:MAG TPA: hypothetical protein VGN68_02940 [Sphingopyxis sp.]|jgi:hypothetical protein|uniref:hypothetical protein n=1 Tax=Sphingopyxis sp. TaxID=1908224 RepID=UPI002E0EFCC0|nr:hypothetical protein [Sphingopyxis sp.]
MQVWQKFNAAEVSIMRQSSSLALLASAALLMGAPAGAHMSEPPSDATATDEKERLVCKRAKRTGTRFESKICKTAAAWKALTEQHERDAGEMINRPVISIEKGN